jgi:hypothetical protein
LDQLFAGEKLFLAERRFVHAKPLAIATDRALTLDGRGEVRLTPTKVLVVLASAGAVVSVAIEQHFNFLLSQWPMSSPATKLGLLFFVGMASNGRLRPRTVFSGDALKNVCISMSFMNLGWMRDALPRLRQLKNLGVGLVYFAAAYKPSESSKDVHYTPQPTDQERFVEQGNYLIRVENYKTGRVRLGDKLEFNDGLGNPFSTTGEWNPTLAEDPAHEFRRLVQEAHFPNKFGHTLKVIVDFITRFTPVAINETN